MLVAIVSSRAMAIGSCGIKLNGQLQVLQELGKRLEHSSGLVGTRADVNKAPCRLKVPPSEDQLLSYFAKQPSAQKTDSMELNGIKFENEDPQLLKLFADLHHGPGKIIQQIKPSFSSSCKKVLCAVQEIYGQKQGLQILYLLSRYGFNASDKVVMNSSAWRVDELDDVLVMFADFPPQILPIEFANGWQFVHHKRGVKPVDGVGVYANAKIEVFDRWGRLPREERQSTLFHEVGHVLGFVDKRHLSEEWLTLSRWKGPAAATGMESEGWTLDCGAAVSKYGQTNPVEDFAETVTAYRYNAVQLKRENFPKYEYMRLRVFDGVEYDRPAGCQNKARNQ